MRNNDNINGEHPTDAARTIPHLSPREHQICRLLPSGATNREIAKRLQISVATVKEHLTHIFEKFGIHDRTVVAVRYVQGAAEQNDQSEAQANIETVRRSFPAEHPPDRKMRIRALLDAPGRKGSPALSVRVVNSIQIKLCSGCKQEKPVDAFHKDQKGVAGRTTYCKECNSAIGKQWHSENRLQRNLELRCRLYNISPEEVLRMQQEQANRCAICGNEPTKGVLHIDHDHATGAVRALLCAQCNRMLGMSQDSVEALRKGAQYLESWRNDGSI